MNRYQLARTPGEALQFLQEADGQARLLAGGTDLWLERKEGKNQSDFLVDISRVEELRDIRREGTALWIGAAVTFRELEKDPLTGRLTPALSGAAAQMGSPQIRNVATIGGNLVTAQPAADAMIPLFALEALAEVQDPGGVRRIPLASCYRELGVSRIDPTRQLVRGFVIPDVKTPGRVSASRRLARRKALTLPVAGCAVSFVREGGRIRDPRVVAAPLGIHPQRITALEDWLAERDRPGVPESLPEEVFRDCAFRDSALRGSGIYRSRILPVLILEALQEAWNREVE